MYLGEIGILLVGSESFRGQYATMTAANALMALNVKIDDLEIKKLERGTIAKRSLGPGAFTHGIRSGKLSFDIDLMGSNLANIGNSAKVEKILALLLACRLTPTYNAESGKNANSGSIEFSFNSSAETPCSLGLYINGLLYKFSGCVGKLSIKKNNDDLSFFRFEMQGNYLTPVAEAIPADVEDYFPSQRPGNYGFPLKSKNFTSSPILTTLVDHGDHNLNISSYASSLTDAGTTNIYLYDRTKDSNITNDWYRDQSKSWFPTIGIFPKRVWITTSTAGVKIYNAETNALLYTMTVGASKWLAADPSYIFMYNGVLYCARSTGVICADFINDRFHCFNTTAYQIGNLTISQHATNITYTTSDANLAIRDNTVNRIHANTVNGKLVIGVSHASGLSVINPEATSPATYDLKFNTTNDDSLDCFITKNGYVYFLTQNHATNTDCSVCIKTALPTADDTAITIGATYRAVLYIDSGTAAGDNTNAINLGDAQGSSDNTSIWCLDVLQGGSNVTAGLNKVVFGTAKKGAVIVDEATLYGSCTSHNLTVASGDLANASDVIYQTKIDPLHRCFILSADALTVFNDFTDAIITHYDVAATRVGVDQWGDFIGSGVSTGASLVYTNGTAIDYSGNEHHLRNIGNIKADSNPAFAGKAFTFNGTSQYFKMEYDSDFDVSTGDFTFACLFNHATIATTSDYLIDRLDSAGTGFRVYMESSGKIVLYASDDNGASNDTFTSAAEYDDGLNHALVITRTGTTVKFYIDGTLTDTNTLSNATSSLSGASPVIFIGAEKTPSLYWAGSLQAIYFEKACWTAEKIMDWSARFLGNLIIKSAELKYNQIISYNIDKTSEALGYVKSFHITDYKPELSLEMELPDITKYDINAEVFKNNPALRRFVIQQGEDSLENKGNIIEVVSNISYSSLKTKNVDDVVFADVSAGCYETAGNINDQTKIIFR